VNRVTRRQVVQGAGAVGLALLAGCGRWPGQAQAPARLPRVGYLTPGDSNAVFEAALSQGLRELGYTEGANIIIERRDSGAEFARLPDAAAELVRLPVDLILARGAPAISAAKAATRTIPIVMTETSDPVELGFVTSLARPGENVTGLSLLSGPLAGKRLELLQEIVPGLSRAAVVWDARSESSAFQWRATEQAAPVLGMEVRSIEVPDAAGLPAMLEAALGARPQALMVVHNALTLRERARIIQFAAENSLPAMYAARDYVTDGGLAAYGANLQDLTRRATVYMDKILKGAKPANLPVEQPRTFDFVINSKTVQALGLTIPYHVLLQATEIFQ
jgi:putative tryptophan/tyrosine transport system substrate-binding protein